MSDSNHSAGVMGRDYAAGRTSKLYLNYRYRVRAQVAVNGYGHFHHLYGQPLNVLELGAAEGRTLVHMRSLLGGEGEYVGVELSDELLAEAGQLPENTSLLKGDVTNLPDEIKENHYDLCTVLAVLEHLPDPILCVREALRVLKPGGVLVATCPNPVWDEIAGFLGMVADEHHEAKVTGKLMVDMALEAGFKEAQYRPFMCAATGILPYFGIDFDPELSLKIDAVLQRTGLLNFTFVNQALVARKAL